LPPCERCGSQGKLYLTGPLNQTHNKKPGRSNAMTDDLIFLKAAGWLVLAYNLFRAWQHYNARKVAGNDPWRGTEHR